MKSNNSNQHCQSEQCLEDVPVNSRGKFKRHKVQKADKRCKYASCGLQEVGGVLCASIEGQHSLSDPKARFPGADTEGCPICRRMAPRSFSQTHSRSSADRRAFLKDPRGADRELLCSPPFMALIAHSRVIAKGRGIRNLERLIQDHGGRPSLWVK